MKLSNSFAVLSALALTPFISAQSTLEEKWEIGDNPTFEYSNLDFSLEFPITDFILPGQAQYALYTDGCKEDGIALTSGEGLIGLPLVDTTNSLRENTVTLDESATVKISVDPAVIASNTNLYSEDTTVGDVTAQIRFCVRFGLYTGAAAAGTQVEVNFLETIITLDVDLSDGFEIASIAVAPKDKLVRTAAQAYQVEGYICDEQELEVTDLAAVRNQGAQIRVCVRPDAEARADGVYMRSIDNFTWRRDAPVSITQVAVENRQEATNTLTSLYCVPGELVCHFISILFASFYATLGSVAGAGVASMQFGGDNTYLGTDGLQKDGTTGNTITDFTKRRNLRMLQEDEAAAASEFDLSFDVDQGTVSFDDTSAASSVGTMAMSLVAAAGAVMMI